MSDAMNRLRQLVAISQEPTYETTGGIIREKTKKQREQEWAVANEVVRFAFGHAGIRGTKKHLAPSGLMLELLEDVRKGK